MRSRGPSPGQARDRFAGLSGANTYTGNTTISGGTLQLAAGGWINNAVQLFVGSGGTGTLNVNGGSYTSTYNGNQALVMAVNASDRGTVNLSSGTIALNGSAGMMVGSYGNGTFNQTGGYFSGGGGGIYLADTQGAWARSTSAAAP